MGFSKEYYSRQGEARRRIQSYLVAMKYKDKDVDDTPTQYQYYRSLTWREFASKLRDEVTPTEATIARKLAENGLMEEDGDLVALRE